MHGGLDLLGDAAFLNVELFPVSTLLGAGLIFGGIVVDFREARESLDRVLDYGATGHMSSYDMLDIVGPVPEIGAQTDSISALSKLTGKYLEYTP